MDKVVVDIFGGDNAPNAIIDGCLLANNAIKDIVIVMVGQEQVIKDYLVGKKYDASRIEILDASEVITNDDVPTVAIKNKKDSSLVKALDYAKLNDDCIGMVSAGSTGSVLAGATLRIGRIRGIQRPALAPILPTVDPDKKVLLIDCGANVDCKPSMLLQFAEMGEALMSSVYGVKNARIGLLSNGTEDKKGNAVTHEAFGLLRDSSLNFVGNMEAREILSGDYDVVVADGFWGNVALKATEGTAKMMLKMLKRAITSSLPRKLAALALKPAFNEIKNILDYNKSGGAPFVGVKKIVIKSHGSSEAESIFGSIKQVVEFNQCQLIAKITDYLNKQDETVQL